MGLRTFIRDTVSLGIANVIYRHIASNSLPLALRPIREEDRLVVSVLLPSRQRTEHLEATIDSLYEHAANPDDIEILIRLDDDDPQLKATLDMLKSKLADNHHISTLIGDRYQGYRDMHLFINELCQISRGDFLFLFNDDARINTPDWDQIMAGYRNELCCLCCTQSNYGFEPQGSAFPALHRKIYEIIGHFSLYSLNDDWINEVLKDTDLQKPVPIDVIHRDFDRTDDPLNDSVNAEYRRIKRDLNVQNKVVQRLDREKILAYIEREGTSLH